MDEPIEEGISRRTVIKRIGVVGAVAWSAPVLSSFTAPAFAASANPNPECAGQTCATFTACSSGNPDCVCTSVFSGGGLCIPGSTACATLTLCPIGNECAAGELCIVNTCCGNNVCAPVSLTCAAGTGGAGAARASSGAGTIGG